MAIDARIPLAVNPPQVPDLAAAYKNAYQLQNMKQQRTLQQQSMQENEMKLQEMRDTLQAERTARKILAEDPDPKTAMPKLVQAIGPKAYKIGTELFNLQQSMNRMDESQLDLVKKRLGSVGNLVYSIQNAPEEKRPTLYKQAIDTAVKNGYITREQVASGMFPAEYPGDEILNMWAMSNVDTVKQVNAEISRLRADSYANNVASLAQARELKSETDRKNVEIKLEDLKRKIDKDVNLDEVNRERLSNQITIAQMNLRQRQVEESNRNRRFEEGEENEMTRFREGEAGKTYRTQLSRASIEKIAAAKNTSAANVMKAYTTALKTAKDANKEDWDDLESDVQDRIINAYFDAFVTNTPTATESQQTGGFLGMGKNTERTVKPSGPPITPQAPAAPANTPPAAETQRGAKPTNAPSVNPKLNTVPESVKATIPVGKRQKLGFPDGSVMYVIKNQDGSLTEAK